MDDPDIGREYRKWEDGSGKKAKAEARIEVSLAHAIGVGLTHSPLFQEDVWRGEKPTMSNIVQWGVAIVETQMNQTLSDEQREALQLRRGRDLAVKTAAIKLLADCNPDDVPDAHRDATIAELRWIARYIASKKLQDTAQDLLDKMEDQS